MRTIHAQPLSSPYELHLGHFYAPAPMVGGIKRLCASDVCLSRTSGLSREQREQRPRKTKIGTDVAHVTRDSDNTFKVKRSRSPGSFTHRRVGALGGCSGGCGNVLAVVNCCYVAVCSAARGASAPTREEGISWRPPAYSLLKTVTISVFI